MKTARLVVMLAVVVAVGVILLNPIVSTVNGHTGTQSVTNESVTADFDEKIDLKGYDINSGSETVWGYNETSGNYEKAPSDDYTLHLGPGSIEFNSSSTLIDSGEEVKVSYKYQATGPMATLVLGFLPVMVGVLLLVVVAGRVGGMV